MRFIDWFIPKRYFADGEVLRKVRLWIIIIYVYITYSLLALAQSYFLQIPSMGIAVSIGAAVAFSIGLMLKFNLAEYKTLVHLGMACTMLNFTHGIFTTGGLTSEVVLWVSVIPLVTLLILDKKNAIPWIFVSIAILTITFYLQETGFEIKNEIPVENVTKAHYIAQVAFTIILFIVVLNFDNAKTKALKKLEEEKAKSEELLLNILPEETARELKEKGHADAKHFEKVTVIFTDFQDFTALSEELSPKELVTEINECFKAFDHIMEKYGIEKIKTIGDAYMAAGGLPVPNTTNAVDVVNAALEMRDWMLKYKERKGENSFQIRIGVHTGSVVAGIVGVKKFQYDIWGDTVNTASRMESSGEVGKVNISQTTYELVNDRFNCESRGKVQAKGKGEIEMYFVEKG